jgi:hypothetical protein
MCYNSFEFEEMWKLYIVQAERKAMLAYQTRNLKSWEAQMLERFLRSVRALFTTNLRSDSRMMLYAAQQK